MCCIYFNLIQFDSREDLRASAVTMESETDIETDDPGAALLSHQHQQQQVDASARLERMPLYAQHSTLIYYKLDDKFELGEMAALFFNDIGRVLFYLCISIYLYGDLSIYSAAVAKSLRDLFW